MTSEIMNFDGYDLVVITFDGKRWLRGDQIEAPLGMNKKGRAVRQIYRRHRREFTAEMTAQVELPTPGGPQMTRIYSPRGAALVAMLSRTERAAAFRAWVLDVLENRRPESDPPALQAEIDRLRSENARMVAESVQLRHLVLTGRPFLTQIARYDGLGLSGAEIGRLLKRDRTWVNRWRRVMRLAGLITTPPEVRPLALPEARS